uniref:LysM domain-containing protein n=1 Tax=Palpitomonas bilix TaxID=652834 RepID=A0A7S3D3B2_9EUKA|mmetsp:Transcript_20291/g.51933  ORF Transcript_20291/g.51933 Transcript_20291/m.51933 type:complete len:126 (+) Transcript_20291:1150-1527(+)
MSTLSLSLSLSLRTQTHTTPPPHPPHTCMCIPLSLSVCLTPTHPIPLYQVWAANPKLKTPNDVQPGQEVALGPAYVVKEGENLYDLASRFRADVDTILRVSPNLSSSSQVEAGQRVCVASSYCSG